MHEAESEDAVPRRIRWTVHAVGVAVVLVGALLMAAPAQAHDPDEGNGYVIEGDLVPEQAIPGPGPEAAGAFPTFIVSPDTGSLCYVIRWDQIDPLTGFVIRLGLEEFDTIEVDFEDSPPDAVEEEGDLGGSVEGCIESEPDVLDFLAHEAPDSHVTVFSNEYPQGAAGGFLFVTSEPGVEPEHGEDEPSFDAVTTVLVAPLTVEQVVPDPPDIAGSGEAILEVTPDFDQVCWSITWDLDESVSTIHLHVGGPGEVDPENFRLDFVQEAREFGGAAESDFTEGCISVTHLVDFYGLVEEPVAHYVDVHTDDHPDGALRGQLVVEDEFVTTVDEGHDEEEDTGRGRADLIPHLVAALALLAVTAYAIVALRRARRLDDQPPPAAIAVSAVAYTLFVVSTGLMLLDALLAPSGDGTAACADYDRYSELGLSIALIGVSAGAVAIALARTHPPLRRIAIAVGIGSAAVAAAWILWIPPQGCAAGGDLGPDTHGPEITVARAPLDCDERVSLHGDPDESFEGFATPEEAVAASAAAKLGTVTHHKEKEWLVEIDGRVVAMVAVGDWQNGRYVVFDTEVCADVEGQLGF